MGRLVILIPPIDPVGVDANGNLIFEGVMLSLVLLNVLLNIPIDILSSWGMYRIAKRREIPCPWLAWIPLVNLWILGSIADQYKLADTGRRGWNRWAMLCLQIVLAVSWWASSGTGGLAAAVWDWIVRLEFVLIPLLLAGIVSIYCSLYRLYDSCRSSVSILFTALGVLFSIPTPFLILLASRWENE